MATFIRTPGRSAADEGHRRFRVQLIMASACFLIGGSLFGALFHGLLDFLISRILIVAGAMTILLFGGYLSVEADKAMDEYERECRNWRKGASGEMLIAEALKSLPDEFFVINDIVKRRGNIDHVVIGPTGVFAINSKYWRGRVSATPDGELLWNGRKTRNREVNSLSKSAVVLHKAILKKTGESVFVQGLMVFESTWVDAPFGTTGAVHCIWKDKVCEHIQDPKFSRPLAPEQIKRIEHAIEQMAGIREQGIPLNPGLDQSSAPTQRTTGPS